MVLFFAIIAVSLLCVIIPVMVLEVFADDRDRPCRISGSYSTYHVTYNGLIRENPKDTYYPGDAFYYILKYKGGSDCIRPPRSTAIDTDGGDYSLSGLRYEDKSSKNRFDRIVEQKCTDLPRDTKCRYGGGDISTSAPSQRDLFEKYGERNPLIRSANVTITIESTSKFCNKDGCNYIHHVKPITLLVDVRNPQPHITFERPTMIDFEGFDSKNIDETYYVWDYPALLIEPNLLWREQRAGTIIFDVKRTNTPISEVFSGEFNDRRGVITASGKGTHSEPMIPTNVPTINGDHLEVFYPQSLKNQGMHNFPYDVTVYNIEEKSSREISDGSGSIDTLIVDYTPIFSDFHFPYSMLKTPGFVAFDKKHGVALHYLGSRGTGPDDDGEIHDDRRSKINDSVHDVKANTLNVIHDLESEVELGGGEGIKTIAESVHPTILESLGRDSLGTEHVDPLVAIGDTTVFFQDGYGRIPFTSDGLAEEVEEYTIAEIRSENTLYSKDYGGYDETLLFQYPYLHPPTFLSSIINITSINSDGTRNESMDIDVEFIVNHGIDGTKHLAEYMESHIQDHGAKVEKIKKTAHKSINNRFWTPEDTELPKVFSDIYLGDMHNVTNSGSGTDGTLTTPINLPAVRIISAIPKGMGMTDDMSLTRFGEEAYTSPVVYDMHITANDITNIIPIYPYAFSPTINYTINADSGNKLESTQHLSSTQIVSPDSFGKIKTLTVNGKVYPGECVDHCFLSIEENSTVEATNIWGGTASVDIITTKWEGTGEQYDIIIAYVDAVGPIVMLILVVFTIIFVYAKFARGSR